MNTVAEIQHHIMRYARAGEVISPLPGLRMSRADSQGLPTSSIQNPCVALVAQGAKRTEIGDATFEFRAGQILVAPGNLPIIGQVTKASLCAPYLAMAVDLKPEVIAELIATQRSTSFTSNSQTGFSPSKADTVLLDTFNRLLALVDSPDDVDVLLPMLEREITWRLLRGTHSWLVRLIGVGHSRSSRVIETIRWIRGHYADSVSVNDLATMAETSLSTFYRQFREITAASPLQYQKQIRLQEARMLLLGGKADAITAAYAVGYQSQSQFSREYRRLFGLPPMQDIQRTRAMQPPLLDVI